ncbi:paraquat-inducible protein A [Erwinia mallotivora]|uniref:Paraquat-inducible protein A n=1 Tax=Erwinia mallotivora TaxID=69222 RepID=A0A014M5N8_9GAMM|nr:paraquat-inducible protein A [Erwinia mallotivora]EXU77131.1 hypothetical protein BG55_02125 [Erwinia mallotivora]
MNSFPELAICPCCSHLHRRESLTCGEHASCLRCAKTLFASAPRYSRRLALMLSAVFALPVATFLPLITVGLQGNTRPVTLVNMVVSLVQSHQWLLATIVMLIFVLFPAVQLVLYSWLCHFASRARHAPGHRTALQILHWLNPWCMSDVCLLGLLIAGYKMVEFIQLSIGPGFWALVWVALLCRSISRHDLAGLWSINSTPTPPGRKPTEASATRLTGCRHCGLVCEADRRTKFTTRCPRCHTRLSLNTVDNLSRTTALLVAAIICYFPANLLPVMQTTLLGNSSEKTILSGIVAFRDSGAIAIAAIIFIASVVIPVMKFLAIGLLIITCHLRSQWAASKRTQLYRLTEAIGYLSLLDVIVVVIMSCAMQFAPSVTVEPRSGILFFALSVILTMLSALSFDPRLIWSRNHHE